MRKQVKLVILFLAVIALFSINAAAYADYDDFRITGALSTDTQTEFGQSEIPWLWVDLNGALGIRGWWAELPVSGDINDIAQLANGATTIWAPLTNWGWTTPAETGDYGVRLKGYGNRFFTVTPEPISSALFLFGGAALGIRAYRKRSKKA